MLSIEGQPHPEQGQQAAPTRPETWKGTKVGKVTKTKTGIETKARNNAGHIVIFTTKMQGTAPKIVRRQKKHRKG